MIVERATRALSTRWAVVACGVVSALVTWWVWGSLDQVAAIHDEAAYILQAKLFAAGRWSAPGLPLPEFFEQYHVLVTPRLVPKYPPGHALLLTPGMWLGLPGLVPVLLSGLTGAMIFALARRLANPWVALMTWVICVSAPADLRWRPTYFSEATTSLLWLTAWWALLQWRDTRKERWLVAVAACVGWGLITRPLTMLLFALPLAPIVLRWTYDRRAWGALGRAAAVAAVIVAILPLWNSRTTGDWRLMPYTHYAREYFPADRMGFGFDSTPPGRTLPADMVAMTAVFEKVHRVHTIGALPSILWDRVLQIGNDQWRKARVGLLPFAVLGVLAMPVEGLLALATSALLVMGYLVFGYHANWTLYYLELHPVLAFAAAVGLWHVFSRFSGRAAALALLLVTITAPLCAKDIVRWRRRQQNQHAYHHRFRELVRGMPDAPAIVFVRYGPEHLVHWSLIQNAPDLEQARVWIVYDRGPDNERLLQLAPERTPYLYDEVADAIVPLPRAPASPDLTRVTEGEL